jgi:hypothetical protein
MGTFNSKHFCLLEEKSLSVIIIQISEQLYFHGSSQSEQVYVSFDLFMYVNYNSLYWMHLLCIQIYFHIVVKTNLFVKLNTEKRVVFGVWRL